MGPMGRTANGQGVGHPYLDELDLGLSPEDTAQIPTKVVCDDESPELGLEDDCEDDPQQPPRLVPLAIPLPDPIFDPTLDPPLYPLEDSPKSAHILRKGDSEGGGEKGVVKIDDDLVFPMEDVIQATISRSQSDVQPLRFTWVDRNRGKI